MEQKCPHCRGTGNLYYEPCSFCGGSGFRKKSMNGYPKDLHRTMRGLWENQYAPREEFMLSIVGKSSPVYKRYKRLPYTRKIKTIDSMHSKGLVL